MAEVEHTQLKTAPLKSPTNNFLKQNYNHTHVFCLRPPKSLKFKHTQLQSPERRDKCIMECSLTQSLSVSVKQTIERATLSCCCRRCLLQHTKQRCPYCVKSRKTLQSFANCVSNVTDVFSSEYCIFFLYLTLERKAPLKHKI